MTRRQFLQLVGGVAATGGVGAYGYRACGELETRLITLPVAGLPEGFHGCRVAFLSDLHLGWFIPREYIASVVNAVNAMQPDVILLGGDFVNNDSAYILPVMEELGRLRAPLGVMAVQGNRDIRINRELTTRELARQNIREMTNVGCWLERGGGRIWFSGIDDATRGRPDVAAAMNGCPPDAVCLAMTHSPDLVETLDDPRIRFVCCGHTHGGQIWLPLVGRPFIPSAYGQKYAYGLAAGPHTTAYITSGVGAAFPPVRYMCPPEIVQFTLAVARQR